MDGIQKIKEKIISDAKQRAKLIKEEAVKAGELLLIEMDESSKKDQDRINEKNDLKIQSIVQGTDAQISVNKRLMKLAFKRDMIDQAFNEALVRLAKIKDDRYIEYLVRLIDNNAEDGAKLSFSAYDLEQIVPKLIKKIKHTGITINDKPADIMGGCLIDLDEISINCSLEAMLEFQKEELEVEVVKILFG